METYGVSFEGFEPSCGWPSYNSWTEKIIPREKSELVRWGKILEDRQRGLATIKEAQSELAAVKNGCQKLLARFARQEASEEHALIQQVNEKLRQSKDFVCVDLTSDLRSWLAQADPCIERLEGFYAASVESTEKSVADAATIVDELKNCLRFWEHALEVMKMHHVFEKAELRYKTKICREIVKELTSFCAEGRCLQRWMQTSEHGRELVGTAMEEDAQWLIENAEEDLKYYRQIKADIAANGLETALKQSTRKVTPPQEVKSE